MRSNLSMAKDDDETQPQEGCVPQLPPCQVVAVAVSGRREGKYIVKWAMEKFAAEGNILLKLLHIRPAITAVPTPMGNMIPLSQVREDVAAAYKQEIEWQRKQMLLPYKKLCARKKIQADILVIESDDVAGALAEEVTNSAVNKLVIGAATPGLFSRRPKKNNLSSRISACIPSFCTVYAVSRGKLSSIRPSELDSNASVKDDSSVTSTSSDSLTSSSIRDSSSVASYSHFHSPFLPILIKKKPASSEASHSRYQSTLPEELDRVDVSFTSSSDSAPPLTRTLSDHSFTTDAQSWMSDQVSTSDVLTAFPSPASQVSVNFELEKLRIELRHARGMYAVAHSETAEASQTLNNLKEKWLEESMKLKDVKSREERVKELAREEQERYKVAKKEAVVVKACAEREASHKRDAELKALRDMKEKENLENALLSHTPPYRIFTWEEIASATSSFSESHTIGKGAYGTVYRCSMHHTDVAVKVLHNSGGHKLKQFEQELEILSKVRHPHLLLLIGACPDHGCLIYEHMENGSLEDQLLRKNGAPAIPWYARFRIAWEVASALAFLHNSKPNPIVHRDLKPANILLDHSFVSKIGDVGLSTALSENPSKEMGPVGTLPYMDPEYQRTGTVSPKSDVYAFGVVIMQLLTARPAIALNDAVETAIHDESLPDILDKQAGNWPNEETKALAMLGLRCAELRRKDRPDLNDEVLPVLEKLKEMADRARSSSSTAKIAPPSHFLCPILKDVMDDPCVAADGYTYDRRGIEKWLKEKDKSPMTNLPLPHKDLIPNHTLRSAIMEWKDNNPKYSEVFDSEKFEKWVDEATAPVIQPSLKLYKQVMELGFKVFLLTGRSEKQRAVTIENLINAGFQNWDKLILRASDNHGKLAMEYKSEKGEEMVKEGYRILGHSGDQWSDLLGSSVSSRSFKLPNPMYYIP